MAGAISLGCAGKGNDQPNPHHGCPLRGGIKVATPVRLVASRIQNRIPEALAGSGAVLAQADRFLGRTVTVRRLVIRWRSQDAQMRPLRIQ